MRSVARERRTRWLIVPAIAAMLLVTACTKDSPDTPLPSGPPTASVAPSGVELPFDCSAWAAPPTDGELKVYRAWLEYDSDTTIDTVITWQVILHNSSSLIAVRGLVTLTFTVDGEDVTEEVTGDDTPTGSWGGLFRAHDVSDIFAAITIRPEWRHKIEFTATATAENWCIPTS